MTKPRALLYRRILWNSAEQRDPYGVTKHAVLLTPMEQPSLWGLCLLAGGFNLCPFADYSSIHSARTGDAQAFWILSGSAMSLPRGWRT